LNVFRSQRCVHPGDANRPAGLPERPRALQIDQRSLAVRRRSPCHGGTAAPPVSGARRCSADLRRPLSARRGEQAGLNSIDALGQSADRASPFTYLRVVPHCPKPGERHRFLVQLQCWPDGPHSIVASAGPPVVWNQ
jgi:hypothetical protein